MNAKRLFRAAILVLISSTLSFQWPMQSGKITSIFGESRGDHFHDGIDIVAPENKIYPVEDGDLVYLWDKSLYPLEHYPGGGNYRVLRHRGGLHSIYLHLDDSPSYKEVYTRSDSLGRVGNTGRSYGRHLHLALLDAGKRSSVNPLASLPEFADAVPPRIGEFYVHAGDRYSRIRDNSNIRLTQHYPLLAEITDSMGGRESLGISYLAAYMNGKMLLEINFSRIEYSKNGLTISGKIFHDLFDEKGFYKISPIAYTDGVNTARVVARDYRGNEASKEISFNVKLETAK